MGSITISAYNVFPRRKLIGVLCIRKDLDVLGPIPKIFWKRGGSPPQLSHSCLMMTHVVIIQTSWPNPCAQREGTVPSPGTWRQVPGT